ncbi:MAG TPA: alpha/beta fold hydrolase [Candidatus Saccharibacteria bacterium]|nr:alpha/beta fold hydrolase [Candidatus Saccharibacteria bacterium]
MKHLSIPCIGYEVAADWYDGAESNKNVLLVLVGYTSSKSNYKELVSAIVAKSGYSALVLDYSGHGESPFDIQDITISENFSEVVRAYDWIKEHHPGKTISVMGTSYGGFFAAMLAGVREIKKLILRVPANYDPKDLYTPWRKLDREQIRNEYRADPKNFENHPVLAAGVNFKGKTYVLTHELDEACPKTSTDPYIKAFKAESWEAKGFVHGLGKSEFTQQQLEEYQNKIAEWLEK